MTASAGPRRIAAPPKAAAMIEALRGLGYSTSTALADVIDNSIAAGATQVDVSFTWAGPASRVIIVDNGSGMTADQLEKAMRLGDRSPLDQRLPGDLGRFGLGLKTASFSQCRRLTVATRRDQAISCLRWDLDEIAAAGGTDWELLEGAAAGSEDLPTLLPAGGSGTLVAWEVLDRLLTPGFREQNLLDLLDHIERHLAMVFHRYLEGPRAHLCLTLNGSRVQPWDPFLTNQRDTWSSPEERLASSSGPVIVQAHVLPHKDRLDPRAYEAAAGPDGWTAQQGFYVYRQGRMLLGGSWLGLGRGRTWTKEESHRLARIRVEIGNPSDADWKIDVRKSTARPPVEVRPRLTALAEDTRERARRVFAWRGRSLATRLGRQPVVQAWTALHSTDGVQYRIDERHPAVAAVLQGAGDLAPLVRAMLRIVEETVPVQRIWLDTAEAKDTPRTGFTAGPPTELRQVLEVTYRNLVRRGLTSAEARQRLLLAEPFDAHPDLVVALPDIPESGS